MKNKAKARQQRRAQLVAMGTSRNELARSFCLLALAGRLFARRGVRRSGPARTGSLPKMAVVVVVVFRCSQLLASSPILAEEKPLEGVCYWSS
ncbi:hypothetical protein MTO96_001595 [Rhipicephalus appendiculatus]